MEIADCPVLLRNNLRSRALRRDLPILDSGCASLHHLRIARDLAWRHGLRGGVNHPGCTAGLAKIVRVPDAARHSTVPAASAVDDLPAVSRGKRTVPQAAARAQRACGTGTL